MVGHETAFAFALRQTSVTDRHLTPETERGGATMTPRDNTKQHGDAKGRI